MSFTDLSGQRFGRLLVQERASAPGPPVAWLCLCDCGGLKRALASNLKGGQTASCGCLWRERTAAACSVSNRKHGLASTPIWTVWQAMLQRCRNQNHKSFPWYGGRGITVCARWQSFEKFNADMGPRPAGLTLDRINNELGYEPGNCRWATPKEQANNRRPPPKLPLQGRDIWLWATHA